MLRGKGESKIWAKDTAGVANDVVIMTNCSVLHYGSAKLGLSG